MRGTPGDWESYHALHQAHLLPAVSPDKVKASALMTLTPLTSTMATRIDGKLVKAATMDGNFYPS